MRPRPPEQVLWPEAPINGESLLGWTVRTAHRNVLPSCYTLLRAAGAHYKDNPVAMLLRTERAGPLATILGAARSEVSSRMLHPAANLGFLSINGVPVRTISLVTNKRRFSPATLRSTGTHLSTWMVRTMPFCPRSWEYLQDACISCGAVQGWRKAGDMRRCDACGADVTRQAADHVEDECRDSLGVLAALLDGSSAALEEARQQLPRSLAGLEAGDLIELAVTIAGLIDVDMPNWLSARASIDEHRQVSRAMAGAWTILQRYPTSVVEALWNVRTVKPENGAKFTKRLAATLRGDNRLHVPPKVSEALEQLQEVVAGDRAGDRNLMVKPAARLLGATEAAVAAARDGGSLDKRLSMSNGRILFNLDREEIEGLAEIRRTRSCNSAIGLELAIPPYAVAQLVGAKLLDAHSHPWLTASYGGPQATRATIDDFVERLRKSTSTVPLHGPTMTLATVMRGFGGGVKPWAEVFRRMTAPTTPTEAISFELGPDGKTARDIRIATIDATVCWRLAPVEPEEVYSQLDALDVLNHALKKAKALKGLQVGEASRGKWLISGAGMVAVARDRMSWGELVARTGMETGSIRSAFAKRGLRSPNEWGWDRAEVLERAGDICWRKNRP